VKIAKRCGVSVLTVGAGAFYTGCGLIPIVDVISLADLAGHFF
jgi:hypothetical protein